jgi:hypothetical protein
MREVAFRFSTYYLAIAEKFIDSCGFVEIKGFVRKRYGGKCEPIVEHIIFEVLEEQRDRRRSLS